MTKDEAPIKVTTKVELRWLLVFAFFLGTAIATSHIANASFERQATARMDRIEQNLCLTQENLGKVTDLVQNAYTDRAVIRTKMENMTDLLTEIRQDIKDLKAAKSGS